MCKFSTCYLNIYIYIYICVCTYTYVVYFEIYLLRCLWFFHPRISLVSLFHLSLNCFPSPRRQCDAIPAACQEYWKGGHQLLGWELSPPLKDGIWQVQAIHLSSVPPFGSKTNSHLFVAFFLTPDRNRCCFVVFSNTTNWFSSSNKNMLCKPLPTSRSG